MPHRGVNRIMSHPVFCNCNKVHVSVKCAASPLLFHVVSDKQAFITSWTSFLRSLLISVHAVSNLPACHNCLHCAIVINLLQQDLAWTMETDDSRKCNINYIYYSHTQISIVGPSSSWSLNMWIVQCTSIVKSLLIVHCTCLQISLKMALQLGRNM